MTAEMKQELIQQYESFIWKRTREAMRRGTIDTTVYDADDLHQEASIAFFKAVEAFDPEKGALINLAWASIKNHFAHLIRSSAKQIKALSLEWSVSEQAHEVATHEAAYALADLDAVLTDDERVVVRLALGKECKSTLAIVKKMNSEYGWTKYRARKACKGVRAKLKG